MQVTSPKEMQNTQLFDINSVLSIFETQLLLQTKGKDQYSIMILGELSREVGDLVEKAYIDAGWSHVSCRNSTEKGFKPGMTYLVLSMKPIE